MRFLSGISTILLAVVWTLAFSSRADGQATRTWVSGVGDDANPCSRTAPCKTFAGAISKTSAGGEIDCLDPGGFGTLTITKAITIDCDSGVGSVLASSTNGIVVSAGPNDIVYIRNLTINGTSLSPSPGINGVRYLAGKGLFLQEVDIFGFTTNCVDAQTGNAGGQLTIENSNLSNCGSAGVNIATTNLSVINTDIHNVHIWQAVNGINAGNGSRVNVRDCVITLTTIGIAEDPGTSTVLVSGSTLSFNGTALQSAGGGFIGASGNTFANNSVIVFNTNGGSIYTGNDNLNFGNAAFGATTGPLSKI
jgi:hypothetical protein